MTEITFSLIVNYIALVCAVWLGWYVVTRSPRSLIAWLTSLTLWSVSGLFLNMLFALNPPPDPAGSPGVLRLIYPFWPAEAFYGEWVGWLQGWLAVPAIATWHHVTMLLRPGNMDWWRWMRVISGYALALVVIWVHVFAPHLFVVLSAEPMMLNRLEPGPLYTPFLLLLLLFSLLCLMNLVRSALEASSKMPRRQLIVLAIATLATCLTAPVALAASIFGVPIPRVILSILLMITVILIGYSVARYSALIEGRTIRRDFLYNAAAMALITLIYSIVTWVSVAIYDVPAVAFVFIIMLAIITHNLVDTTRRTLDSIFYRRENRQIRASLRKLASQVGEEDLPGKIALALEVICNSVRATYGLVLLFDGEEIQQIAGFHKPAGTIKQPLSDFYADDLIPLEINQFPSPLHEAAMLVPLYSDMTQSGAIVLGRPVNSETYSQDDIELLLYPSDLMAEAIHKARREKEYLQRISEFTQSDYQSKKVAAKEIENALRNLSDYARLGDCELARLNLVRSKIAGEEVTFIDRGKAVNRVVIDALEKLRPDKDKLKEPPPREWHPYIILHGAYIDEQLNRDIMSRLYISEGTFNRTRRAAIRSLARILGEMETANLQ